MKKNEPAVKGGEKGSPKPGTAKAAKLEAEVEYYRARLSENEERLRAGEASDGSPLTELQRANLEKIISKQRERLIELSA